MIKRCLRIATMVVLMAGMLGGVLPASAQTRKVQNRPYIDLRAWHYGFLFGLQSLAVLVLSGLAGFVFFGIMRHAFNRFLEQQVADLDGTFAVEYNRELSLGTRDDLRQFWSLTHPVLAGLLRTRWRDLPVFTWGALRRLQRDVARTTGVTAGK